MRERYSDLETMIDCLMGNLVIRKLMKQELNRQYNCLISYANCSKDCKRCHYYDNEVPWSIFSALIDRVDCNPKDITRANVRVVESMRKWIAEHPSCTELLKNGSCNHNCSSCGL